MGIGASVFLIAVGAILEWALPNSVGGVHLGTIGVILMLVGILGLAAAVFIYGPRSRGPVEPARPVAEPEREVLVERPVERERDVRDRDVVVEREAPRSDRAW